MSSSDMLRARHFSDSQVEEVLLVYNSSNFPRVEVWTDRPVVIEFSREDLTVMLESLDKFIEETN